MSTSKIQVVIIGGGFSGGMTTLHLLRHFAEPNRSSQIKVKIVEPRVLLGRGLAYSTPCHEHLLNVPALGMSAFPDEPDHFFRHANGLDASVTEHTFVPRYLFGEYVTGMLTETLESSDVEFEHVRSHVTDIRRSDHEPGIIGNRYQIALADGVNLAADIVVLAIGNLSGKRPRWTSGLAADQAQQTSDADKFDYLHDPWQPGAIASIGLDEDVLLIGTGLTAVDKIVELKFKGHRGKIYAASRHGFLPQPHVERLVGQSVPANVPTDTVCGALHSLRQQVCQQCKNDPPSWRLVFDGLRSHTQDWWRHLIIKERRRFLRHLKTYFDVHRHRMAPHIAEIVEGMRQSGQVEIHAARLVQVKSVNGRLAIDLAPRHSKELAHIAVDRMINCMGPQSGIDSQESPLLRQLVESGIGARNALGTSLAVSSTGQLLGGDGRESRGIFAVGPLLQGELLESVAVPELKVQSQKLADVIGELISTAVSSTTMA